MSKISLKDRVEFLYGFSVRVDSEVDGKYPVYGSNGITGYIDNYKVEGPGVIIGRKGTVGAINYSRNNFTPTDTAYYLSIKDTQKDDFKFWYYYLQLLGLDKLNTHSSVPGLSREIAYLINVSPPEIKTQLKISSILSVLDSKIEQNYRINTELEAITKTIYDYWFVQFDFPTAKGMPYKASGGEMVWNDKLKRDIPKGWGVKKIGEILKTSLGGTPSTSVKEYWENGNISWLNSGEIANFPIIESELKITEAAVKGSATDLLPRGSVLLSITRHLRPSILAIDACANQSVVGILEKEDLKSYYIYPYLKNEIPRLMLMRSGAQQPHISKEIVDDSLMLMPPESSSLLKEYNSKVEPFYDLIINNAFQSKKLAEVRDWLLPMLMNGQVKIS